MPSVFPPNTYPNMIVNTPGIVHYMRMGDFSGSGDDADSLSGFGGGGVSYRAGGSALVGDDNPSIYFNGTGYINYGNNLNLTGAFTVEVWIWPALAYTSGFPTFLSKENYNSPVSGWSFYLEGRSAGAGKMRPIFMRASNFTQYRVYGTGIDPGTWTYLVCTYDGATLRLYQNNNLVSSTSAPGTIFTSGYSTLVGMATNASAAYYSDGYNGYVDELAIYNTALSQATITEHWNRALTAPVTNLYLSSGETVGLVAAESSSMFTDKTATETVMLRDVETVSFSNTLGVVESPLLGMTESGTIETAFGGTILGRSETVTLGNTASAAIATFTANAETAAIYSTDEQQLASSVNVVESPVLLESESGSLILLADINRDFPAVVRRRQGFIHYAAQRKYNGHISIEFSHEAYAPVVIQSAGALGQFVLNHSTLGDYTQSPSAQTITPFLVRTQEGLPLALGQATTSWWNGLVVVQFFDDMTEHDEILQQFGVFPTATG